VAGIVIDPGLGFYYANLTDPMTRTRFQTEQLLQTFRLRTLGVPVCQSLPHAFDIFTEHYRSAEAYFAVLAMLGRADLLRTHEVAQVRAVCRAMALTSGDAEAPSPPPAEQA
jgi:dihydropteroate synthase